MTEYAFHPDLILKCTQPDQLKDNKLLAEFTKYIQHLIENDFEKLVQLLYRIDVDESKLKQMLQTQESSAAVIAQSIIRRISQTLETKAAFKQKPPPASDPESWS